MWWTPDDQRVLQGAEATLFQEALGTSSVNAQSILVREGLSRGRSRPVRMG
jgi:hypothetical protein